MDKNKDLRLEDKVKDKDKDLRFKDKDKDKDLSTGPRGQGQ